MTTTPNRATGWINVISYDPKSQDDTGISEVHVTEEFTGGLTGTGSARFLMVTNADGGVYFTGMERFIGIIAGRDGSFILRNTGILKEGEVTSEWLVIPGSATGGLTGLRGTGGTNPAGYFLDFWFE